MATANVKTTKQSNTIKRKKPAAGTSTKSAKLKALPKRESKALPKCESIDERSEFDRDLDERRRITPFKLISALVVILMGIAGYWITGLMY